MSNFLEDQGNYFIKGSIGPGDEDCRYLVIEGESVRVGGPNPDDTVGIFTAILDHGSGGTDYGFQPMGQPNYVNCQQVVSPDGEDFWVAQADVCEPAYFVLKPNNDGDYTVSNILDNNLMLTMGADEGLQVLFESKSGDNTPKQKWVFVKSDGSSPDIPGGSTY